MRAISFGSGRVAVCCLVRMFRDDVLEVREMEDVGERTVSSYVGGPEETSWLR
jgi:hypothetical protein